MKLHIGGTIAKDGWLIYNVQPGKNVNCIGDISLLPFINDTFTEVYASHVLEHVATKDIAPTLCQIYSVIKPGGSVLISVPDIMLILDNLRRQPTGRQYISMLFGGQVDQYDLHRTGFNYELLASYLNTAGFKDIRRVDRFGIFEDFSNHEISLNVVAFKP